MKYICNEFNLRRRIMKKLMILVLVLAMAPMASAGIGLLDITISKVGTTYTIVGLSAIEGDFGLYVDKDADPPVQFTVGTNYAAAGGLAVQKKWDGWNGIDFTTLGGLGGVDPVTAGTWFDFTYTGDGVDDGDPVGFDMYDYAVSNTEPVGTLYVPEPITIALLGLGGLFLRRRK
jgi:hypothetical protein